MGRVFSGEAARLWPPLFYFAKIARRRSLVPIKVTRARVQMTAVRP
jgi:hypothetical protein